MRASADYISRPPIMLKKLQYVPFPEGRGRVIMRTKFNDFQKENLKVYDAEDFIAALTQFIPPPRARYVRKYGFYSPRLRAKWEDWDHIVAVAPSGWREKHGFDNCMHASVKDVGVTAAVPAVERHKCSSSWARLLAKVFEVDPLECPVCHSRMKIVAIVTGAEEVDRIVRYLTSHGHSPPDSPSQQAV